MIGLLWTEVVRAQAQDPGRIVPDTALSAALGRIMADEGLAGKFPTEDGPETVSFAVIDLHGPKPLFGGVSADFFIYPASVYKMYVAAEVLHQASEGRYSLMTPVAVKAPNDVDRSTEISWDPRPLLKAGDTVTVGYLLDLMITRSDNSAANCLIDLARRERINALLHTYGWYGSEVTRKYLKRKYEDPGYDTVRGTETSARHAAEFMYRVETNALANEWTSMQMRSYLTRQLDTTKLAAGLPRSAVFAHKTGWFSAWTHDVGIVHDGPVKYIIACFLPLPEEAARPHFKRIAERVHALMAERASH
jgi:beta-lactamase class A